MIPLLNNRDMLSGHPFLSISSFNIYKYDLNGTIFMLRRLMDGREKTLPGNVNKIYISLYKTLEVNRSGSHLPIKDVIIQMNLKELFNRNHYQNRPMWFTNYLRVTLNDTNQILLPPITS